MNCKDSAAVAGCGTRTRTSSAASPLTGALFWVGFFYLVTLGVLVIGTFMLAGRFIDELPSAG